MAKEVSERVHFEALRDVIIDWAYERGEVPHPDHLGQAGAVYIYEDLLGLEVPEEEA